MSSNIFVKGYSLRKLSFVETELNSVRENGTAGKNITFERLLEGLARNVPPLDIGLVLHVLRHSPGPSSVS